MRSLSRVSWCGALALVALAPLSLAAQQRAGLREVPRNNREGFWASFGLGGASERFEVKNTGTGFSQSVGGPSASLRLGGTVNPNVLVGGELYGWTHEQSGETENLSTVLAIGQFYPSRTGAFFLKTGLGFASFKQTFGGGRITDNGFGGVVGAGYDLRVGRNVSITPTLDFYFQEYGDFRERLVNLGFNVTLH